MGLFLEMFFLIIFYKSFDSFGGYHLFIFNLVVEEG